MKKIYLLLSAALITSTSFGQLKVTSASTSDITKSDNILTSSPKNEIRTNKKSTVKNFWIDYKESYEALYGATASLLNLDYIFPDTLPRVKFSNGIFPVNHHSAAQVIDLEANAFKFDPTVLFDKSLAFNIDTIQILGQYQRPNNAVTDTLLVTFIEPSLDNMSNISSYTQASVISQNLGGNSATYFFNLEIDSLNKTNVPPAVIASYKIPLDASVFADSLSNGLHYLLQTVNVNISGGKSPAFFNSKFAVLFDFIPGYTYNNTDTLGKDINSWRFTARELNGDNTFPTYDSLDYNATYFVDNDILTDNAGPFNGLYAPSYAYMGPDATFTKEVLAIQMNISQDNSVGIKEVNEESIFSVYPNPSAGEFNINLNQDMGSAVNLTVRNVVGQTIISKEIAIKGNQIETISLTDYSKGIYFLTIDNETVKLIVE